MNHFWISIGLRKFWDKETVLRFAARACSKQYCLTLSKAKGSCIAWASRKTGAPKLSEALIFFGYFFVSRQKSNYALWASKRTEFRLGGMSSAKPNEQETIIHYMHIGVK
jgi:hypothetical protein